MLRRRLALAFVLAAGIAAPATAATAAPSTVTGPARALCGAGYVSASVPWGHKCLRAGEFCKIGNRAYIRYGFYCPSTGHLRRR